MARRIRYSGDPVLTVQDVVAWVRDDLANAEEALIRDVIIPTVTAQCEAETGAAIRKAEYVEDWPAGLLSRALDVGQAVEVLEVKSLAPGSQPLSPDQYSLLVGQRISHLTLAGGCGGSPVRITYKAGVDFDAYPSVKTWMLLQAGTLFQQRESLITGTIVAELPLKFIGSMLADITVPPRF